MRPFKKNGSPILEASETPCDTSVRDKRGHTHAFNNRTTSHQPNKLASWIRVTSGTTTGAEQTAGEEGIAHRAVVVV